MLLIIVYHSMIRNIIIIGLASFIGGTSRYIMSVYIPSYGTSIISTTMLINIIGCFIIGLLYGIAITGKYLNPDIALYLMVGFCGSFTTFSTFSLEVLKLLETGNYFNAITYIILSIILGLIAVYFGQYLIKNI